MATRRGYKGFVIVAAKSRPEHGGRSVSVYKHSNLVHTASTVGEAREWIDRQSTAKRNPAKAVRLKNFTGTIRVNPNKTVSVVGRAKKR